MNISLTPELERMVKQRVESGLYNNASEVVREALRLMPSDEKLYELKLARLRAEIDEGWQEAERGLFVEATPESIIAAADAVNE
jgi:antitoxin ParD1/3/4